MVMETITPAARTLPELFFAQVRAQGAALALRHKVHGIWQRVSWAEYGDAVRRAAGGLLAMGITPGERVAILGDNRPEWLYCHLGTMAAGGSTCGIYATSSPEQVRYLLQHSGARCLFLENEEQLEKVLTVVDETAVERIVVWDGKGLWGFTDERVTFFEDFLKQGQAVLETRPKRLDAALAGIGPDDVAMIIYTSGTTGPPKGAMLSHRNILWEIESISQSVPLRPGDEVVSYLPFAHIFENFTSVFWPIRLGIVVSFAESVDTLFQNLREVSPTYFAGPPRIWEKLASTLELRMADSTPLKRGLYRLAVAVGQRHARAQRGGRPALWLALARRLADAAVLYPLKRRLGLERIRIAVSAAAPAAPEMFEFYHALDVPLLEVYGQTESTGVITANRQGRERVGTVGEPIPGIEVKLAEDGEILTRGPHVFQGYLGDAELTAQTVDSEGWLHTGDVGVWDDGYLSILDRKKDIIITAGGKNVTPTYIENKLKFSSYIQDAVVVGDRRKYLVALILIDEDVVVQFAQERRIPFATFADLTQHPEVNRLIKDEVDKVNRTLSQVESIKRFALLPRRFYEEEGDVTPTKKVKRRNVEQRYGDLIESLYR
jgi:long-chain acyl-CoA synthetase